MKLYLYDEHDEVWDVPEELEEAVIEVGKQIGGIEKFNTMKLGEVLELLYQHMRPPGEAKTDDESFPK